MIPRALQAGDGSRYRWILLALSGVTAALAVAAPTMAMPVLFAEMAADLGLTLVQIGTVWGTASFAGLFSSVAGGMLGDRFGTKRTLAVCCLLLGLTGAARGLSTNLAALVGTVFLCGLVVGAVPMNLHKVCATWFSGRRLGVANAVISGSMAVGFLLGSLLSASVLSPRLGGWREVLFAYGAVAVVIGGAWMLTRESKPAGASSDHNAASLRTGLGRVVRCRSVWELGIALLAVNGAVQGVLGYVALYLRNVGWSGRLADGALSSFHAISLMVVLPLAVLSDRLRVRLGLLIAAAATITVGIGLLSIVDGVAIWLAVLLAGAMRDGFMAVFMTTVTELDSVGAANAGTALGLVLALSRVGALVAPPLGNSLAAYGPRTPFLLWAGMAFVGWAALLTMGRRRAAARAVRQ